MSSSSSNTASEFFDVDGFILCLAAYLLGPETVQQKLLLCHHPNQPHSSTKTTLRRPQRIFWKSPLLTMSAAEETEEADEKETGSGSCTTGSCIPIMDPVIVLLNAMFEYNPNIIQNYPKTSSSSSPPSPSSSSRLSLQWGALIYNKNAKESDKNNNNNKYYYVESSRLTFRDLQRHFGTLDVPLDDLAINDVTVLAKNMAMALLHIGRCKTKNSHGNDDDNPAIPPPPPPPPHDNDDETSGDGDGVLKFPLYYQGFEMYSSIILANHLNHHPPALLQHVASSTTNRQKDNATTTASTIENTDVAAAAAAAASSSATISPYSLGQWRAMLDACCYSSSLQERQAWQDEENFDVAVKNLLKLYNMSFRHSSCLAAAIDKNENHHDAADIAAAAAAAPSPDASLQPPCNDDDENDASSPATAATGQPNKKKKRRRPKQGGYYEQKKAKKPLAYADD